MSRRLVWTTTLALAALVGCAGAATAQYYGNGKAYEYNPYDRPFWEARPDPGYGGASVYRPFEYPAAPTIYSQPQYYNRGAEVYQGAPQYVDPPGGGRVPSGAASDYELGQTINQGTRVEVPNTTNQPPGTIVIDTASRHLYYTQPNGQALQYGIGVGREGFAWHGVARVQRKAEWPDWIPPADMLRRRPDLPLRMSGGIENPLGARAMYLFKGNKDTMFRIHGTNEPDTIGKAVSSGCIRMMNGDVIDLYNRVPVGTKVVVL